MASPKFNSPATDREPDLAEVTFAMRRSSKA